MNWLNIHFFGGGFNFGTTLGKEMRHARHSFATDKGDVCHGEHTCDDPIQCYNANLNYTCDYVLNMIYGC